MENEYKNEDLSFKPQITAKSKLIVDRKNNEKFDKKISVVDRLVRDANNRIENTYKHL